MLCLASAHYALCKLLALADGADSVAADGTSIRLILPDGTDLGGDLLNEYQLFVMSRK